MIGTAPKSVITGVPGWESENEQYLLLNLAKGIKKGGTIVEIGAEFGMSASLFIYGTSLNEFIYSIDLFPDFMLDQHQGNLKAAGLEGRSRQIKGDSSLVCKQWDQGIDFLFIDGDHSYKGALEDLKNWSEFVGVGGVIAVHDCACPTNLNPHPLHYEVSQAVTEWLSIPSKKEWITLQSVDSIMVFKRVR